MTKGLGQEKTSAQARQDGRKKFPRPTTRHARQYSPGDLTSLAFNAPRRTGFCSSRVHLKWVSAQINSIVQSITQSINLLRGVRHQTHLYAVVDVIRSHQISPGSRHLFSTQVVLEHAIFAYNLATLAKIERFSLIGFDVGQMDLFQEGNCKLRPRCMEITSPATSFHSPRM